MIFILQLICLSWNEIGLRFKVCTVIKSYKAVYVILFATYLIFLSLSFQARRLFIYLICLVITPNEQFYIMSRTQAERKISERGPIRYRLSLSYVTFWLSLPHATTELSLTLGRRYYIWSINIIYTNRISRNLAAKTVDDGSSDPWMRKKGSDWLVLPPHWSKVKAHVKSCLP